MESDDARRSELRRFLKARRASAPAPTAAPPNRRRRDGLRIEEVCALADVSTSWYGALEAGKPISVAPRTLERIADALRLGENDREHLFALATPTAVRARSLAPQTVRSIVDGFTVGPAMHVNARLDVLDANRAARMLYGFTDVPGSPANNIPWRVFTDPDRLRFFANWTEHAQRVAGILRRNYAGHAGDPEFDELVARLVSSSADFRAYWERVEVRGATPLRKVLSLEGLGEIALDITFLTIPHSTGTVIFQTPSRDRDAATLARLVSTPFAGATR